MDTEASRIKALSGSQLSVFESTYNPPPRESPSQMTSMNGDSFEKKNPTYGSTDGVMSAASTSAAVPCCMAGDHILTCSTRDFLRRSLSLNSVVHVDISDINGDGDAPIVPLSLRRCKKMILKPYTILLSIIGWRPWLKDSNTQHPCFWRLVNLIYPSIVIMLMLFHYLFQVLSCQGKYNIFEDTKPQPPEVVFTTPTSINISYKFQFSNCTLWELITTLCDKKDSPYPPAVIIEPSASCQHILSTYIVPSIMFFLAFAYGFLHFRVQECEQLYSLMERVFLQAYATPGVQAILIRNSRLYLAGAFVWLVLQFGTELLYLRTFRTDLHLAGKIMSLPDYYRHPLLIVNFFGVMLVNCVNVAVVINYCMQCEMLIFHIKGICLRLHEKTIEMADAMHEILGIRAFISLLNDTIGSMTAFCVVNFAELAIVGSALLFLNQNYDEKLLSYRTVFPLLWLAALLTPLMQAARLTRIGRKLRQISFEMRVFGYQRVGQFDLDSFVLFVNGATLRARLFGVTINPATIILTFGVAVFVILTLMFVDVISVSGYKAI